MPIKERFDTVSCNFSDPDCSISGYVSLNQLDTILALHEIMIADMAVILAEPCIMNPMTSWPKEILDWGDSLFALRDSPSSSPYKNQPLAHTLIPIFFLLLAQISHSGP